MCMEKMSNPFCYYFYFGTASSSFFEVIMGTVNDECAAEEGAENESLPCSHYLLDSPNKAVVSCQTKREKQPRMCVDCVLKKWHLFLTLFNASETLAIR